MTRLVYILAASHSGSTLLSMLLGAHPEVCTVGELKLPAAAMGDLDRYRCSCGQKVLECAFWQRVREHMAHKGIDFDLANARTDFRQSKSRYAKRLLGPLIRNRLLERARDAALWVSPTWRKELAEIQNRNTELVSSVLDVLGKGVIVDSSKLAHRLKFLLRNPLLHIRVVHLIRDGRGVALTYMDPENFADARDPAFRGTGESPRMSMDEAARAWRRSGEEAERILARMERSRWLRLRYEDVCADPERQMARVLRFIEVDPGGGTLDFRSVEHHVIGNGMRLDSSSVIELDERWRSELSAEQLAEFDRVAGDTNRKLGYE
ncbi:MAG: sulfotransferase [Planctomycetes bacterium]|nr:sulfotransferase [Planctomycetota bacterium]